MQNFNGQKVWIIGGSTGIGQALAEKLAEEGAKIAVSSRSEESVSTAVKGLKGEGHLALPLDSQDESALQNALSEILRNWQNIDMVIYAAGIYTAMRAFDIKLDEAKKIFQINFVGALNSVAAVVPQFLKQKKGRLVIVSSVAGYRGLPNSLVYGASKAALTNFTETLYLDLEPKGINVHLVSPGFVKTRMTNQNEFKMPALIGVDEAAERIISGVKRGDFEIHFPRRFTYFVKLLRILPNRIYFYLASRFTGL